MKMMKDFKSFKEIQGNTDKHIEALKEKTQNPLKNYRKQTAGQNDQNHPRSKNEIETIKKSQRETALQLENLGKRSGVIDTSITNKI